MSGSLGHLVGHRCQCSSVPSERTSCLYRKGRRRCHSLTGRACRAAGHTCPPLVHCCTYVKHRPVPLLHLDVLPDNLPPCPVDEQDENVSVVTDDPNRFSPANCCLQHITTERDVRLLMGDETIKFVNELHVIL